MCEAPQCLGSALGGVEIGALLLVGVVTLISLTYYHIQCINSPFSR